MAKRKTMTESELSSLLDGQIADAVSHEETDLGKLRDKALKYRDGVMDDLPPQEGKSKVVSYDVNDTIAWIKPGLMRIFANSDRVVEFEPTGPGDEEYARQATDYINYIFLKECHGYKVLLNAFDDGLGLGNGVVMHWWDKSPCYEVESFTGLSDDAFTLLVSDDDVEVIEHTAYADPESTFAAASPSKSLLASVPNQSARAAGAVGGEDGLPAPVAGGYGLGVDGEAGGSQGAEASGEGGIAGANAFQAASLHDVKIRRKDDEGRLRIEALPPEELLIPRDAKCVDEDISGIGRVRTVTRSTLIKEGFKREDVEALPAHEQGLNRSAQNARDSHDSWTGSANPDTSMEKVRVYEWWPLVDYDGDGVAERRRVIIGDRTQNDSSRKILLNEEWGDELPFTDLVPNPVAHRRRGRSVFDDTQDIQRIKTALLRSVLDNTYMVNNPMIEAVLSQVNNPDVLIKQELGGIVDVKQIGVTNPITIPAIFDKVFPVIEYIDLVKQGRTGVGRQTMGLDPDALQNQTAEAVRDGRAASETQVEFFARNIAEGMQQLFRCLLKLIIKNQDKPKVIRLRDKWVEMDPRPWNASMDCTVNVGLGAGSRDRDMVMLQAIAGKQEQILQILGPDNPICSLAEYRNTLAEMVEVGGLKSAEKYFKEVTPETVRQMMQAMSQKPDPKVMEAQAKLQIEQQKAQTGAQLDAQKAQTQAQLEQMKLQSDMTLKREQMAQELQLKREQLAAELQLKQQQMAAEIELKRQMGIMNAHVSMATSQVEVGGEPG